MILYSGGGQLTGEKKIALQEEWKTKLRGNSLMRGKLIAGGEGREDLQHSLTALEQV